MLFETVVVGQLGVNCFILGDPEAKVGVVVDPGAEADKILAAIKPLGITVTHIINTHGHFDHVGGNSALVAATGAKLLIHKEDEPYFKRAGQSAAMYGIVAEDSPAPSGFLEDGMTIRFGAYEIKVIHTPGHTKGGCCLYLAKEGKLLSGDTLFADGVGRTDLSGGSFAQLESSIKTRLYTLPADAIVYPGHGPSTTIGHEKQHNPYVR